MAGLLQADEIVLNPGYIDGNISIDGISINSATVNASGGGGNSSVNANSSGDYSLIVNTPSSGSESYSVSAYAYSDASSRDLLVFQPESVTVSDGEVETVDFSIVPGFVSGKVSVDGATLSYGYVYAFLNSGGNYTNARSQFGADGEFYFPVQPNTDILLYGYAYMSNGARYTLENAYVNVAADEVTEQSWALSIDQSALGKIAGSFALAGAGDLNYYQIFGNGPNSTYRNVTVYNGSDYVLDQLDPGTWNLGVAAYFNSRNYLQFPYARYQRETEVPSGETTTVDIQDTASFIEGRIRLSGSKGVDDASSVLVYANGYYNENSYGGFAWHRLNQDSENYRLILTEGDWLLNRISLNFFESSNDAYLNSSLNITDYRRHPSYGGSLVEVSEGETVDGGDFEYATGMVTINFSVSDESELSNPQVYGWSYVYGNNGQPETYAYVNASGPSGSSAVGSVTFVGLPGVYDLTARARINGAYTTFGRIEVEVLAGTDVVVDIGGPELVVEEPSPGSYTEDATVTLAGTVTDDQGVATVTVSGVAVSLTSAGDVDDLNKVVFSTEVSLVNGPNEIQTVATDLSGKTAADTRTVYRDSGPPVIAWDATDGTIVSTETFTVEGTATDDNAIEKIRINGTSVSFASSGNASDPNEVSFSYEVGLDLGENDVRVEVTDNSARSSTEERTIVRVDLDSAPPTLVAPPDLVVELTSSAGATIADLGVPVVTDNRDPSPSVANTAPAVFPLGTTVVEWTAEDEAGNSASDTQQVTVQDTVAPEISLNGEASVTLECGVDVYQELGATVSDVSGTPSAVAVSGDTVNSSAFGTYMVRYNAVDASGNVADEVVRSVTVVDTTAPEIGTLSDLTIECTNPDGEAVDLGAPSVSDICDPNPSLSNDAPEKFTYGTTVVTWTATDASGNMIPAKQSVTVQDTMPPVITLNGSSPLTLECGIDSYTELGAVATDACDPAVVVVIGGDTVDASAPGSYVVTYDVVDAHGNAALQVTRTVTVQDTIPPVITLNGSAEILLCLGDAYVEPGATAEDLCAGDLSDAILITGSVVTSSSGTYQIHYDVSDPSDNAAVEVIREVVVNAPPVVDTGGPYVVDEGGVVTLLGAATDDDDDIGDLSFAWDLDGDGGFETPEAAVDFDAALLDGPSSLDIALQVTDSRGCSTVVETVIEIVNVAPTIETLLRIGASGDPIALGGEVTMETTFSDPGVADTHGAVWDWGDETSSPGVAGTAPTESTGSHVYAEAGVYRVTVIVTDDDGGAGTEDYEYIVVYDPEGGFVTGGGHIHSPAGAYAADPALSGKANFGFVSKYKKGATIPSGETQFNFHVAGFNFHSTSYQWLVVAGAKAMYKGIGTVNGESGYGFLLSAIDGSVSGGGDQDKFRIKIWEEISGLTVYDNALGAAEDADPPTVISGGNIVVHSGGNK